MYCFIILTYVSLLQRKDPQKIFQDVTDRRARGVRVRRRPAGADEHGGLPEDAVGATQPFSDAPEPWIRTLRNAHARTWALRTAAFARPSSFPAR